MELCFRYAPRNQRQPNAFTLVELLVVVGVIAILASLLLPVLARAKNQARQVGCLNNLHQLGIAVHMYLGDYVDTFPAAGAGGNMTTADWIRWLLRRQALFGPDFGPADLDRGALVPYIHKFSTRLMTCPADRVLEGARSDPKHHFGGHPSSRGAGVYAFSYTLNSSADSRRAVNPFGPARLEAKYIQRGMASLIEDIGDGTVLFRMSSVNSPSDKIMFADEEMYYEMNAPDPRAFIWSLMKGGSSGWEWPRDQLTRRHNGRGTVTFADGHVSAVKPQFAEQKTHYDPME